MIRKEKAIFAGSLVKIRMSIRLTVLAFICLTLSSPVHLYGQSVATTDSQKHELTVYLIPSVGQLNWESPSTLYQSYLTSYISHALRKKMSLTGHFFIKLTTPLLNEPLYAGMSTPNRKEKHALVTKSKVGLAIFGASMKGELENGKELIWKINYFSKKHELAYIRFQINENAAKRIIEFYRGFTSKSSNGTIPADYYGGAYWPRYENEGAACSSFVISVLDLIGLRGKETDVWLKTVDIPMDLIGGKYNHNKEISIRQIRKAKHWADASGIEGVDFYRYSVYDPSEAFRWILNQRKLAENSREPGYNSETDGIIPGLSADRRTVMVDPNEPIFIKRPKPNLFIP